MSDLDKKIPGFDDFLLSAEEIRSSADSVIKDGISYNVQSNVARCLLSINENKATGEALVKIGLEDAIRNVWGGDFIFDVKEKIYKEKAIKSQPELFNDAFNQPDIFLTVLANTIDEIVERGFVCVIFNQFGLNSGSFEAENGEEFVASHFPNDDNLTTKERLIQLFWKYNNYVEGHPSGSAREHFYDLIWSESEENIMPTNWNMILSPNLDLVINW